MSLMDYQELIENTGKVTDFITNKAPVEGMTPLQNKLTKWGARGLAASAIFIAGTSMLDASRKRVERKIDKENQEEELKKQSKKIKKGTKAKRDFDREFAPSWSNGYYNVNPKNIVFDMFNDRMGHHKMGNNKFQ